MVLQNPGIGALAFRVSVGLRKVLQRFCKFREGYQGLGVSLRVSALPVGFGLPYFSCGVPGPISCNAGVITYQFVVWASGF